MATVSTADATILVVDDERDVAGGELGDSSRLVEVVEHLKSLSGQ